jgi:hypothetical protein
VKKFKYRFHEVISTESTVGEGRLWERLRIYSGKYLFNKSKFYLVKFQFFYAFCGTDITAGAQHVCKHYTVKKFKYRFHEVISTV